MVGTKVPTSSRKMKLPEDATTKLARSDNLIFLESMQSCLVPTPGSTKKHPSPQNFNSPSFAHRPTASKCDLSIQSLSGLPVWRGRAWSAGSALGSRIPRSYRLISNYLPYHIVQWYLPSIRYRNSIETESRPLGFPGILPFQYRTAPFPTADSHANMRLSWKFPRAIAGIAVDPGKSRMHRCRPSCPFASSLLCVPPTRTTQPTLLLIPRSLCPHLSLI